jgi:hypothetical protein
MRQTRRESPLGGDAQPPAAREPDGATFEAVRIGARRQRPPIVVLGFAVVIVGLVAVGLGTRSPAGGAAVLGSPVALASGLGTSAPAATRRIGPGSSSELFSPDMAPVVTSPSGPIVIQARRHPETMYVHGDVFVERATWVFVSLQDASGRVAGWASVSVPGAVGPGVGDGPTLRFDVELALPSHLNEGSLWIQVNAHDSDGQLVANTRLEIDRDGRGPASAAPGASPGVFVPVPDAMRTDIR